MSEQDEQKPKKRVSSTNLRLFVEIGVIGIVVGFMVSVLADAFYEAVTGVDQTLELAFLAFWIIFSVLFLVLGIFSYRMARSLAKSGYHISASGLFSWCWRRIRRGYNRRSFLITLTIVVVCLTLAFGFALLLTALLYLARNPDLLQ